VTGAKRTNFIQCIVYCYPIGHRCCLSNYVLLSLFLCIFKAAYRICVDMKFILISLFIYNTYLLICGYNKLDNAYVFRLRCLADAYA